ncbi:hypothetical protein ACHAXR_013049 [Thalassiosira sp. AJA248-18]
MEYLAWRRVTPLRTATEAILSTDDNFVTVSPSDYRGDFYTFQDQDGEEASFGDSNDVKMEYEARHPGTSEDSDVEDGVDATDKYLYYRINERTSPITTTASRLLFSVAMDAPDGEGPLEMKAAYRHQLSIRIDEARKCLNLDCYEFKPHCIDMEDEANPPLPTNRNVEKFQNTFNPEMRMRSGYDSDSDDCDEDDEWLDKHVTPREGTTFPRKAIVSMNHKAAVGNFVSSRSLRLQLRLADLTGIRLMRHIDNEDADGDDDDDAGAVLILEIRDQRGESAFASRMVRAKYHDQNDFATIPDWTPGGVASKATRFYFYGNLVELRQTAALIAKLCPRAAAMLASGSESNALRASVSVEYGSAPSLASKVKEEGGHDDGKGPASKKTRTMTEHDVHKALVDAKIVDSLSAAEDVNPCLKKAILLGHIEILPSTTSDTIVYKGKCCSCSNKSLVCTMSNAVDQTAYGDNDCGEGAVIICDQCDCGNHITRLCQGNASYDCGKFHNHCTDCPAFGQCIGDYREAHCHHCDQHYFQGMSGFSCPNCGGGKSKKVSELAPPPPSTWDGKISNIEEVYDAMLAREPNAGKRAMMKAMVLGPDANYDGREMAGVMSALVGALGAGAGSSNGGELAGMMASMAADQNGAGGSRDNDEECRLM